MGRRSWARVSDGGGGGGGVWPRAYLVAKAAHAGSDGLLLDDQLKGLAVAVAARRLERVRVGGRVAAGLARGGRHGAVDLLAVHGGRRGRAGRALVLVQGVDVRWRVRRRSRTGSDGVRVLPSRLHGPYVAGSRVVGEAAVALSLPRREGRGKARPLARCRRGPRGPRGSSRVLGRRAQAAGIAARRTNGAARAAGGNWVGGGGVAVGAMGRAWSASGRARATSAGKRREQLLS